MSRPFPVTPLLPNPPKMAPRAGQFQANEALARDCPVTLGDDTETGTGFFTTSVLSSVLSADFVTGLLTGFATLLAGGLTVVAAFTDVVLTSASRKFKRWPGRMV